MKLNLCFLNDINVLKYVEQIGKTMLINLLLCPICWTIGGIYALLAFLGVTSFGKKKINK